METFITYLFEEPSFYLSTVIAFMGSICVHEFCHAFVAHRLGDHTAKEGGYMTLNPLKVMGWMSIAALLLFGISWGAVPVKREDPDRLRRAAISLAGPFSNLVLLAVTALVLKAFYVAVPVVFPGTLAFYCRVFFFCLLYSNAVLFLLNILPIPPLDGWCTIEPFLPEFLIPSEKSKMALFKLFILGMCLSSTSGYYEKGIEAFASKFLPKQVNAMSLVAEGERCLEAQDYPGAYKAFSAAAEQGSSEGKLYQANCLAEGYGCEQDYKRAFALFSEKDVSVFPLARFYLGVMRMEGLGCTQDCKKAYEYLSQEDVQQEYPLARACLGLLLANGPAFMQDLPKAFALLNDEEVLTISPEARYVTACFLIDGEVCDKDERRAFALLNDEEVLAISPEVKFLLGLLYYQGAGTTQDFAKAAQYIKEAADAGDPSAAQFLGYQNGSMPDYGMPLEELLKLLWKNQ